MSDFCIIYDVIMHLSLLLLVTLNWWFLYSLQELANVPFLLLANIYNRSYLYLKSVFRIFSLKISECQVCLGETLVICTWGASFGPSGYRIKSGMTTRLVFGMTTLDWIKNLSLRATMWRRNLDCLTRLLHYVRNDTKK